MRIVRSVCALLAGLLVVVAVGLFIAYRASQSIPDFYQAALEIEPVEANEAGDELEHQMLELQNDLSAGEAWELQLSETQINGWLSSDLPQKFPKLLPREVKDPRVALDDGHALVACRIETSKFASVLSLQMKAYLTDEPNVVAIRISKVRAGRLPVPLGDTLDKITKSAQRSGIEVRWGQEGGDPVALVTLPTESPDLKKGVLLESLVISDEQVTVAGMAGVEPSPQSRVADSSNRHNLQR